MSLYYPGLNLLIFTVLNLAIVRTGTTGAVPLGMYFSLVLAWFLVSTPLTFLGGMMAVRACVCGGGGWPCGGRREQWVLPFMGNGVIKSQVDGGGGGRQAKQDGAGYAVSCKDS